MHATTTKMSSQSKPGLITQTTILKRRRENTQASKQAQASLSLADPRKRLLQSFLAAVAASTSRVAPSPALQVVLGATACTAD
jgi:hypothetical protein